MNWEAIGALGDAVSGVGVVVTLVYLALQIRQNTKALKVSAYADFVTRHLHNLEIETQHAELIARSRSPSFSEPSASELMVLIAHHSGYLRNGDALFYQFQQGLIDRSRWDSVAAMVAGVISESETNRSIWRDFQHRYEPGFRAEINDRLQNIANRCR
jgi:hypothetical protein